jgi:hypothetical protein
MIREEGTLTHAVRLGIVYSDALVTGIERIALLAESGVVGDLGVLGFATTWPRCLALDAWKGSECQWSFNRDSERT